MANSTRRRAAGAAAPEPPEAGRQGLTAWQAIGLAIGLLMLVAGTFAVGVGLGFAWGRASGRAAALERHPMLHQPVPPGFGEVPFQRPSEPPARGGGGAFLGVTFDAVDPRMAADLGLDEGEGALVVEVTPGGPADEAGVRRGDVILVVSGQPVRPAGALRRLIQAREPGDSVQLFLLRGGEHLVVTAELGVAD